MLRNGEVGKTLVSLSVPAVTAMLIGALYNVVDTMFIGLLGDTPSIGAATVVFPLFMLISAIGLSFGVGAASAVSRLLGAQRKNEADQIASTAFYTNIGVALIFTLLSLMNIEGILSLFGATETILERATVYGSIIVGGCIFRIMNMCLNNLVRSQGAARYSSAALILGTGLNILLDPLFMFGFGLGLRGAAMATIVAQAISTLFLLFFFISGKSEVSIHIRHLRMRLKVLGPIMKIGIPTFFRQLLASAAMSMMNIAARRFGDAAIAAVGIDVRLISLVMFVFFGVGQGFQPFAGYNHGAGQYARVRLAFKLVRRWSFLFGLGMMLFFQLLAQWLPRLFTSDPEVIRIATTGLRLASLSLWYVGVANCGAILFQAVGKGRETAFLALSRQGLFYIPLLLILPPYFGLVGIMISQPIADLVTLGVTTYMLKRSCRFLEPATEGGDTIG